VGASLLLILLGTLLEAAADYFDISFDVRAALHAVINRPHVAAVLLIGLEEAGIPLPVSGDLLILYSTTSISRTIAAVGSLAVAFELSVLAGASILFALSQRFGRRLLHGAVGEALHLSPQRIATAERWFKRFGIWAVIVGRHVPGFRVATTVVAASFGVPYPVFLLGVTVSAGVWVAAFVALGLLVGPHAERLLGAHHTSARIALVVVALAGAAYVTARLVWRRLRPGASRPPSTDLRPR
jgi:membrane protein DedA with SNARE-associated domain